MCGGRCDDACTHIGFAICITQSAKVQIANEEARKSLILRFKPLFVLAQALRNPSRLSTDRGYYEDHIGRAG